MTTTTTTTASKKGLTTYTLYAYNPETLTSAFLGHFQADSIITAYTECGKVTEENDVRIFPSLETVDGVSLAALQIARSAAKRSLTTGTASATERNIYNGLTHAMAIMCHMEDNPTTNDVNRYIARVDHDAQEFYGVAVAALWKAMKDYDYIDDITSEEDLHDIYREAYKAISKHIRGTRTRGEKEVSTEYIAVNGGDLVSITAYTAKLVGNGERYTPDNSGEFSPEQIERLARVIQESFSTLKQSHKDTAKMLVKGMSQSAIARKEGVTAKAVNNRVCRIREVLGEYIETNAPEFKYITEQPTETANDNKVKKADYMRDYMRAKRAEQRTIKELFENKQDK